jgi:hypothetical protein
MAKTFVLRPASQGQKVCRRILKGLGLSVTEASPDSERAIGHEVFMGSGLAQCYPDLARRFPDSRFILLDPPHTRPDASADDRAGLIHRYGMDVEAFFAGQPDRLLRIRLPGPEAKARLRAFLELPTAPHDAGATDSASARRARQHRRRRARTKVFCIGFHKTGTTSLERALEYLGYRVTGRKRVRSVRTMEELFAACCELIPRYNAFQDNPWPLFYRELDQRYPGSKFILTRRPAHAWLQSQLKHFGSRSSRMRELIYGAGYPLGNEAVYLERYNRHNAEVLAYFRDRPGDLLDIDLTAGEGWDKLCPFLGHPLPAVPFPCSNTAQDRLQREQGSTLQSPPLSRITGQGARPGDTGDQDGAIHQDHP